MQGQWETRHAGLMFKLEKDRNTHDHHSYIYIGGSGQHVGYLRETSCSNIGLLLGIEVWLLIGNNKCIKNPRQVSHISNNTIRLNPHEPNSSIDRGRVEWSMSAMLFYSGLIQGCPSLFVLRSIV